MKPRQSYTKQEKMRALYAYATGKTSQEALYFVNPNADNSSITDEKHALKLLNKWKQELYLTKKLNMKVNQNCNDIYFDSDNSATAEIFTSKNIKNKPNNELRPDKKPINERNCTLVEKPSLAKEIARAKRQIRKLKKEQEKTKEKNENKTKD